jgi:hypothetical protein
MRRYAADGLVVALLCLLLAYPVRAAWPLTSSQTITLEHGPDGLWLSQAWVIELQIRQDVRLAAIYDLWHRSEDGVGWTVPCHQMDVSVTWEPQVAKKPLALTAGRRWHLGHDGQGPAWVYGTLSIGW